MPISQFSKEMPRMFLIILLYNSNVLTQKCWAPPAATAPPVAAPAASTLPLPPFRLAPRNTSPRQPARTWQPRPTNHPSRRCCIIQLGPMRRSRTSDRIRMGTGRTGGWMGRIRHCIWEETVRLIICMVSVGGGCSYSHSYGHGIEGEKGAFILMLRHYMYLCAYM